MSLILASGSPRRRELMALITPDYRVVTSEVDESRIAADTPARLAQALAAAKARAVAAQYPGDVVVGCDTVVDCGGVVFGKPRDEADAVAMLCRWTSPEVIICDEVGRAETEQLLKAADCGTALICSAHAADTGSLEDRGFIGPGSKNLFPLLVRATRTDGIYGFTAEEI